MTTPTQSSTTDKAKDAASQARDVGEHATQATQEMTQVAKDGAQKVASEVRQQGSQLTQEATQQLQGLAEEASSQLRDHASTQTERVATQLRALSEQTQAFAEGRIEEAGALPQYAHQATDKLSTIAQRLQTGGADGALSDVRAFARRKPGTFLLLAGAAGFAAGRILRGAKAPQDVTPTANLQTADNTTLYLDEPEKNAY